MLRPPPGNRQNPPNPPPHGNLEVPLLGDPLYGGDQTQLHRAALHAYGVTLYQPYTGEKLHLTAPIPEDIRKLDLG